LGLTFANSDYYYLSKEECEKNADEYNQDNPPRNTGNPPAKCDWTPRYQPPDRPDGVPWWIPKAVYDTAHPPKDMGWIEMATTCSGAGDNHCTYETYSIDGPFSTFKDCEQKAENDNRKDNSDDYSCEAQRLDC
jgi:hypothetical protein